MNSRSVSFRAEAMLEKAVRRKRRSVDATFSRASEKWILTSTLFSRVLIWRQSKKRIQILVFKNVILNFMLFGTSEPGYSLNLKQI